VQSTTTLVSDVLNVDSLLGFVLAVGPVNHASFETEHGFNFKLRQRHLGSGCAPFPKSAPGLDFLLEGAISCLCSPPRTAHLYRFEWRNIERIAALLKGNRCVPEDSPPPCPWVSYSLFPTSVTRTQQINAVYALMVEETTISARFHVPDARPWPGRQYDHNPPPRRRPERSRLPRVFRLGRL